jgi:general secretion pathway protein C
LSASIGFTAALTTLRPRVPDVKEPQPAAVEAAPPLIVPLPTAQSPATPCTPPVPAAPALPALRSAPSLPAPPPQRSTFAVRAGPAPLLGSFRVVGLGPSGGLRLGRVLPQSLAGAIGLQSGDELISVNQFHLGDPAQALTAYARLRTADRLTLAVDRRGKRTEIVYSIR